MDGAFIHLLLAEVTDEVVVASVINHCITPYLVLLMPTREAN